jgi:GNAT superfamily N-acetyltransferase
MFYVGKSRLTGCPFLLDQIIQDWLNPFGPYRRVAPNPLVTNFIARIRGKCIGFAQLVYHPEDHHPWVGWWIFSIVVRGPWQGMGYGEKLTGYSIEEARIKGVQEVFLAVYEDNKRAINLYGKLGFAPVVLPPLEKMLAEEKMKTGRRRMIMKKQLR